jgi:NAD(P)H-dependent FMN reductase
MSELLIIAGTNREEAISPTVANIYLERALEAGFKAELIDLRELPEDYIASALYNNAGKNTRFNPLREKMKQAKKFVFIVPEYNGSFPGILKAFIDGLEFPGTFQGKKAALVGISAGVLGSALAMSHLTDILNYCGTSVLALKPRLTSISKNLSGDEISNEFYLELIQQQIQEFKEF